MKYIYQSCSPLSTFSTKLTQIVQTEKVSITEYSGLIFKDSKGLCWSYLGEFENTYIPPSNVFNITYQGNYFETESNLNPIFYPDCDTCLLTQVSACTEIYFLGENCDNKENVIVKVCDVGPVSGNLRLKPILGDVYGIKNPNGDDFCVTLKEEIKGAETVFEILTPAWKSYDCQTCPIYKVYTISSLDNSITNLELLTEKTIDTLTTGTTFNLKTNNSCFIINNYEGMKINFSYDLENGNQINQVFSSSADCMINFYKTII